MTTRALLITTAVSILACSELGAQPAPQGPAGQGPAGQEQKQEQKKGPPAAKQQPPAAQGQPQKQQPPAAQTQPPAQAPRPTAQEQPKQPSQKAPPKAESREPAPPRPAQAPPSKSPAAQTQPPATAPQAPGAQEKQPQRPAQKQPTQPEPPAAQKQPTQPQPPAAKQQPAQPQPPAAKGQPTQPQPPAAKGQPTEPQPPAAKGQPTQPQPPAAKGQPTQPQPPAAQGRPAQPPPPAAERQPTQPQPPAAQGAPVQPQAPAAQAQPAQPIPRAAQGQPVQLPGARRVDELRGERREVREGNRVVIHEPNRMIIREGGRTIIRHNEVDRFRYGARDVRVDRRGTETFTVVERPDGVRIVTVTDDSGRLIRRVRRDPAGREIVIIDNRYGGPAASASYFVDLPPPVIRIPRERYIVEAEGASEADIYETLVAQPVERLQRRYTLDEIRYSPQLRERMPRVDVDTINFETGSWEVSPDQAARLSAIAAAIKRAVSRNPSEVFLVEGHTDAVGPDEDNLSLSDRRAESVALVLTEQFQVPAENLTSQGYGEQQLKVPSDGPERRNRRVTLRRITPLLSGGQAQQPGG